MEKIGGSLLGSSFFFLGGVVSLVFGELVVREE